jgi:hypothetical protein
LFTFRAAARYFAPSLLIVLAGKKEKGLKKELSSSFLPIQCHCLLFEMKGEKTKERELKS